MCKAASDDTSQSLRKGDQHQVLGILPPPPPPPPSYTYYSSNIWSTVWPAHDLTALSHVT